MIRVFGQRKKGARIMSRDVTTEEFMVGWGRWASLVFQSRNGSRLTVGDKVVWVELLD